MSLDVYLLGEEMVEKCPGRYSCNECGEVGPAHDSTHSAEFFSANVTHNLNTMAHEAGVYEELWRPEECDPPITKAKQLIEPLRAGLALLRSDPARFEALNPANGWGSYERFVPWVAAYLAACEEHPEARVRASR